MTIFNVPREGRNKVGYMEHLIYNMYLCDKTIYRRGYGILDVTPEYCIASINVVRSYFGKINPVKVHYMELVIEKNYSKEEIVSLAETIGKWFWNSGYQCLISVALTENGYYMAIVINAVSYVNGNLFRDNNNSYLKVLDFLRHQTGFDWTVGVTKNTFFDINLGAANYQHGVFA